MAQKILNSLNNNQSASGEQIRRAAIEAKKIEVKLAAAKLGHAEYHLASLAARADYLEARCSQEERVTRRELEELAWIREALPINNSTVNRLSTELEKQKRDLEALLNADEFLSLASSF
jgi:hypothetical protein